MAAPPTPKSMPAPPAESVEQRFHRLESNWRADTQFLSDPGRIMGHPAMQAIIAMGEEVVPCLLRELQAKASLLAWALPAITGEDLAPAKSEGGFRKWDIGEQTEAWLRWGREKGLL